MPAFAKKRFGQHFLHDPAVIDRIVNAVGARVGEHIVEIGPGRGALTPHLLAAAGALDAVEIDRDLAARLRAKFAGTPGFVLHETDALRFDFAALAHQRGGGLRIVGNLPYNISTPLLFHLLEAVHAAGSVSPPSNPVAALPPGGAPAIQDMHVMLQSEVVDRMVAAPGSKDYGRLTVMLAPYVHIERLFEVGPGAFQPPPKVWSAVARLTVRKQPAFAVNANYARIVAAAFAQRRKTVRNSLRQLLSPEQVLACGVDPGTRPETLAPEAFNALANALS